MRKFLITAAAAGIVAAAFAVNAPSQAQPYGYGPGYGMMGGYGRGWMMGPGYGPGMMGGYGPGWMMGPGMTGPGYGRGWMMHGWRGGYGPGMMGYGPGYYGGDLKLSTEQVKDYLERMIRNPNLKVGDVKEKDSDTIVAEIVTKQGNSLVQRLDFNRHTGFVQPEQ